jgi:hypothetical protein
MIVRALLSDDQVWFSMELVVLSDKVHWLIITTLALLSLSLGCQWVREWVCEWAVERAEQKNWA